MRPVKVRSASEHLLTLSRMLKQVSMDERLPARRRRRLGEKISALMTEFQKDLVGEFASPAESGDEA